jgi:23S rRNA pseudouridine1911/1915/1917 synthase
MNLISDKENVRIDVYLAEKTKYSRGFIKKNINKILVNGAETVPSRLIKLNDDIQIDIDNQIAPQNIPLDVVYEDSEILVVNKPRNFLTHPDSRVLSNTLVNALLYHCNGNLADVGDETRPGIVHRLDKDTSGLLVCAKTDAAYLSLKAQMSARTVLKKYRAIACGVLKEDSGEINAPLARDKKSGTKRRVDYETGKEAITQYKVLERFNNYTYAEIVLKTGRTHQIRVHFSYINRPILGDPLYGPKKYPIKTDGQILHSQTLGFSHPATNEPMEFTAPLPPYFARVLKILDAPKNVAR